MSERDELAKTLHPYLAHTDIAFAKELADAVLSAGYRKPLVSMDDLRAVRDDAWKRGYEACREGKQKHSPYSAS